MEALLEGIQNRGHSGGFLTSCEAELQELMKQIDIMVAHKKSEWEGQTHALETCLDIRDRELKTLRSQLDTKHKEVDRLRHSSCFHLWFSVIQGSACPCSGPNITQLEQPMPQYPWLILLVV